MVEGYWLVLSTLGATILGAILPLFRTWLNWYLKREGPDYFDKKAMHLLKIVLVNGPKWREIDYLSNIVGLSHQDTKQLLILIDARGNRQHPSKWGLLSRNPIEKTPEANSQFE